MTRNEFIGRLRRGLIGLDPVRIDDAINDYETHFEEGLASGRSEEEIAAALGDPVRLARELRAEAGFQRWEEDSTPRNMAGALVALLGLATVDVMLLFPFLFTLGCIFLGLGGASFGMFVGGIALSMVSLFPALAWFGVSGDLGGVMAMGLAGVGLIAGGIGLGSLTWLAADFLVRLLVRYARLHFHLIDAVTV
jgi:uncharacterized membrane protein